jgi:3-oxoacyl-(acyl-carrier-protein) synthase
MMNLIIIDRGTLMLDKKRKVVVTGIGVISPAGLNAEEFWTNSLSGNSFTSAFSEYGEIDLLSRVQGKVNNFNFEHYGIGRLESERMGRTTLFALSATRQALADSGLTLEKEDRDRIGVCISSAIADTPCMAKEFEKVKDMIDGNSLIGDEIDDHIFSKAMFNCMATEISARYGLHGISFNMSTGCTGGIDAVGYSFDIIKNGESDVMICGAAETPLSAISFSTFDQISATSRKNDEPEKASSPFDGSRDGFVLAEGCGILILEEYERAVKRGAGIYAEIGGYRSCNNAWHMTDLPEDGAPIINIMNGVIEDSGLNPHDIDYINAHGSSTKQNDVFESNAYKAVFGDRAYRIPVSSAKSMVGHPLSAASAVEMVQCCLILKYNKIPPTINYHDPDPQCDLDYVPNVFREKNVSAILKDASGFSGLHSVMVLKK